MANRGGDCKGRLPTPTEISLDKCEHHAVDFIDRFSVNGDEAVLEAGNTTGFQKSHGEMSVSTSQAILPSQGIEEKGHGSDASQ